MDASQALLGGDGRVRAPLRGRRKGEWNPKRPHGPRANEDHARLAVARRHLHRSAPSRTAARRLPPRPRFLAAASRPSLRRTCRRTRRASGLDDARRTVHATSTRATMRWMGRGQEAWRPRVLVLSGPTASGKSALALRLAEKLHGEVISADSAQVFRGMDVGADKADAQQRRRAAHHMLDLVEPGEKARFSAGAFAQQARDAATSIAARGKVPIAVGGSGMYLRWFVHGAPNAPPSAPKGEGQALQAIQEAHEALGEGADDEARWEAAKQRLVQAGDPTYAKQLKNNDYRRLRRALEVVLETGQPMSSFKAGRTNEPVRHNDECNVRNEGDWAGVRSGTWEELDMDFRCFFLCPSSRILLYRRIDARCEHMLRHGILEESFALWKKGLRAGCCSATQSIGYRHMLDLLERYFESSDEILGWKHVESTLLKHQQDTRRLATKQMTWFRGENLYRWMDSPDTNCEESIEKVADRIVEEFNADRPRPGDQGTRGLVEKEELRALKAYRTELTIFQDVAEQEKVLELLHRMKQEVVASSPVSSAL